MKKNILTIQLFVLFTVGSLAKGNELSIQKVLEESSIKGGLVVHIGDGNGETLAGLRANESCLVQ
ncbi:MAG: hypothetical protein KAT00_02115, partial [Planctomycetes bacterium]|nr:hypothetical protein [Planctomycetota bacterium]